MQWQYELWCRVGERIGTPSTSEEIPQRIEELRRNELIPSLPATVELFGVSALSRGQLDVLVGLGHGRDVHVSLLHPSAVAWLRTPPIDVTQPTVRSRRGDKESPVDTHPLLRSWGRQHAETAALVRGLPAAVVADAVVDAAAPGRTASLLAHVRADLQVDRPSTPFVRPSSDTSIQVHACHGTIRQLEVLRDALGHLFVADPSLRPDDVIVICPDLDRFAPFAAAVFGRGTLPIPVMVSDLSLGTENPVAAALARILHTIAGRCTVSDVLAVAALDPVRRRLNISLDDLDRYAGWTERLGTRWGLDIDHRRAWLGGDIELGTWEWSLRSLLLGAAMPAPQPRLGFGGIAPFDDLGGDDLPSVGRLAELVARLRRLRTLAIEQRTVGEWCEILVDTVTQFCAVPPVDAWQPATVVEAIDDIRRSAADGGRDSIGTARRRRRAGSRRQRRRPSPWPRSTADRSSDDHWYYTDAQRPGSGHRRARVRRHQPPPGERRRRRPARRAAVCRRARPLRRTTQSAPRCNPRRRRGPGHHVRRQRRHDQSADPLRRSAQ